MRSTEKNAEPKHETWIFPEAWLVDLHLGDLWNNRILANFLSGGILSQDIDKPYSFNGVYNTTNIFIGDIYGNFWEILL